MARVQHKKRKARIGNAVIFTVTFLVFLIVFGGLCLWAVIHMNEERRANEASSSIDLLSGSPADAFSAADVRQFLLITVDNNQAQGFVAVRLDPTATAVKVTAFPRDMVVEHAAQELRLFELYASQGAAAVRNALAAQLHCTFDTYAALPYASLKKLVDQLGNGVCMELSESLSYHDDTMNLQLPAGIQYLSSSQAIDVLRYPDWRGGRKQRADIQAQMIAALVNQYLRQDRADALEGDFTALVNQAQSTDLRRQHLHEATAAVTYLSQKNNGSIATAISLAGEYVGSGDALRFVAADSAAW